jgi:predicted nuclease of predicted toxin-antitoxin system
MKLLLDENLTKRLRYAFSEAHEVWHVREKGWQGKKNGELLQVLLVDGFEALVTIDKNLAFQQNFVKYPIPVFVLDAANNILQTLIPFVGLIEKHIQVAETLHNGVILIANIEINE